MLKISKIKTQTVLLWHLVVHLFRTVKDIHHNSQRASQVFGCLCLPSASWPRGGAAHSQMKGLSQGYVTPAEARPLMVYHKGKSATGVSLHVIMMYKGNLSSVFYYCTQWQTNSISTSRLFC